jgi:hypothetical protein
MSHEIITPTHPDWDSFVRALWGRINDDGHYCAGDLHETVALLEEMGADVAASLEQLDSYYGCRCDCEVLVCDQVDDPPQSPSMLVADDGPDEG